MIRRQQVVIEDLQEAIRLPKGQLGKYARLNDDQRRRQAVKGQPVGRKHLLRLVNLVTPDARLAWHRRFIAQKYDPSQKREPGRPLTSAALRALVLRMAREKRSLGYTRMQGALQNISHETGRGTITKVVKAAGVEPAPNASCAVLRRAVWAASF